MVGDYVEESGMTFNIAPLSHFFHIEKSETYKSLSQGVTIAEFIYLKIVKHQSVKRGIEHGLD